MLLRYYNTAQENVKEWQFLIDNIDETEITIQSDGTMEGRVLSIEEFYGMDTTRVEGFTIRQSEYNPDKPLREEALRWLKEQLEESVIDTI